MTPRDPITMVREIRADIPEGSAEARALARAGSIGVAEAAQSRRRSNRRYLALIALATVLTCLVAAGLAMLPRGSSGNAEAAALARLTNVAENQRQLNAKGRNLYVLSRFTTTSTWTLAIKQSRLDELTRNAVAMIDARTAHPSYRRVYPAGHRPSRAQRRRSARLLAQAQKRSDDRVRRGVKASDLGVSKLTISQRLPIVSWQNDRGEGAAGGSSGGSTSYGSPAEKRAAGILGRAQLAGLGANPIDFNGFEYAWQPISFSLRGAQLKALSDDPATLRRQLAQNPSRRIREDDQYQPGSPRAVFIAATTVLSSPYAAPRVRAAALKVAASLPGVEVTIGAHDARGRVGVGLTQEIRGGRQQLVFDQNDSRVLGMNLTVTNPLAFQGRVTVDGARGLRVLPRYDSGSIRISYDRPIVTRGEPVCHASFCARAIRPVTNP
jgi:hypothetical protein